MITEIHKDILKVQKGVICHQVNCLGAVGGLADDIAKKWPKNKVAYKQYVRDAYDKEGNEVFSLGKVCNVQVESNIYIANLFGQYDYGRDYRRTEYCAVEAALKCVKDKIYDSPEMEAVETFLGLEDFNIPLKDIYIPKWMGCGLGGGDWNIVIDIINKVFDSSDKHVYICEYK